MYWDSALRTKERLKQDKYVSSGFWLFITCYYHEIFFVVNKQFSSKFYALNGRVIGRNVKVNEG